MYLGQLFKIYGNPVISKIRMNINIKNKISFFDVHWDMYMQLVRDQIYYNAFRAERLLYMYARLVLIFFFI